jgi:hypothetical protein
MAAMKPPAFRVNLKKLTPQEQAELKAAISGGPVRLSELSAEILKSISKGFAQTEPEREEAGWKHIPDPPSTRWPTEYQWTTAADPRSRHSTFHEQGTGGVPPRPFFNTAGQARARASRARHPNVPHPWRQPWCAVCGQWIPEDSVESTDTASGARVFIVRCHGQREEALVTRSELGKVTGYGVAFRVTGERR